MNQNYYPIDFQAQYQETSQKMIEITNKHKDKIRTIKPASLEDLQQQQDELKLRIDDFGLQFKKESIYSQFASGQVMAEKRKQPPEMCPQCGQELKKQIQCEFCAQLFCPKCCCRKRVIPFVSKDIRLCCEQCHWKFVKLFDNKNFYQQKEKLANVIHFVKNKIVKISEKVTIKSQEVEEQKKKMRDEKIKQKALDNKIIQQEKKLKQIDEEFRRVVAQKAQKMQEEQRRRRREQEEREKARQAQAQRERIEQQLRKEQQKKKEQERIREEQRLERAKQQEENLKLTAPRRKNIEEEQLLQSLRKKQEELRRREQQLLRKEQQIKKQDAIQRKSFSMNNSAIKTQTPKQSISKNNEQKLFDTTDAKSVPRSRKGSTQQVKKPYAIQSNENLVRTELTKSTANLKKSEAKELKEGKTSQEPTDSLERSLANMFKPKKQDDAKSMYSSASRTSKSILDMSVNELLAVRIPLSRTSSKVEEQQKKAVNAIVATTTTTQPTKTDVYEQQQQQVVINPKIFQMRRSVQVEEQQQLKQEEIKMHKDSILKNSSLITNKQSVQQEVAPQKCACQVM